MWRDQHPVLQALLGTLFTWGLTAAGSALVFVFQSGQVWYIAQGKDCQVRLTDGKRVFFPDVTLVLVQTHVNQDPEQPRSANKLSGSAINSRLNLRGRFLVESRLGGWDNIWSLQ